MYVGLQMVREHSRSRDSGVNHVRTQVTLWELVLTHSWHRDWRIEYQSIACVGRTHKQIVLECSPFRTSRMDCIDHNLLLDARVYGVRAQPVQGLVSKWYIKQIEQILLEDGLYASYEQCIAWPALVIEHSLLEIWCSMLFSGLQKLLDVSIAMQTCPHNLKGLSTLWIPLLCAPVGYQEGGGGSSSFGTYV